MRPLTFASGIRESNDNACGSCPMAQMLKTKNIVSSTIAMTCLVSCFWLIGCGASFLKIICLGSTSTYFATTFRSSKYDTESVFHHRLTLPSWRTPLHALERGTRVEIRARLRLPARFSVVRRSSHWASSSSGGPPHYRMKASPDYIASMVAPTIRVDQSPTPSQAGNVTGTRMRAASVLPNDRKLTFALALIDAAQGRDSGYV